MALLTERNLILKNGTIVDSTFIESPSSTRNKEKKRDPDAHSAKKGNTWHFGYKAHVGVDHESGIVHTLEVTAANEHDVCMTANLLTGEEQVVYGDSGYLGAEKRLEAVAKNKFGKRIHYKINRSPSQSKHNSPRSNAQIKRREHEKSVHSGKSRACICGCETTTPISKDTVSRSAKTGRKTQYTVRFGEPDPGCQALPGSLR